VVSVDLPRTISGLAGEDAPRQAIKIPGTHGHPHVQPRDSRRLVSSGDSDLWPATCSSKHLHDIDNLVQKSLQTRELFPRLYVVKHAGRLVGRAAAAFLFAPLRLWARPFHG
jgi:hypothetical protein